MNKKFSKACLSVLALSFLGQGVGVAAQTDVAVTTTEATTSTELTTSMTEVMTAETTTTAEPTTSEATTSSELTSSTSEVTTVESTQEVATTTEENDVEESLRQIGGVVDTVVLPNGHLVFKVRLDSLVSKWASDIDYRIIHKNTGRVVDSGSLYFNNVDRSTLKNFNFWGEYNMNNLITKKSTSFSDDPNGIYELKITGTANSDSSTIFGTVNLTKTINMGYRPNVVASFSRVNGIIETANRGDGGFAYKVSLDSLVGKYSSDIYYRVVHKGTGRIASYGTLYFNDINTSVLKSNTYVGQNSFNNVVTGNVYGYQLNGEPASNFVFQVYGSANSDSDNIFGIVNFSKDLSGKKPLPAGQKEVYRLVHPTTKNYAYTTSVAERTSLVKKGWKYEGVAWKTETTKGERVYRLYNGKYYFYTKNVNEYRTLTKKGWKPEGTAYRSYGSVRIMRLVHPGTKQYFYTRHTSERDKLVSRGWRYEGTAWFSQP